MSKSGLLAMAVSAGIAFAVAATPAHAIVLAPGGSGPPDSLTDIGTLIATTTAPFVSNMGASDFSGTYTEDVIRGNQFGANDLSWFILVTNNPKAGAASIETVSASSFLGIATTDVGWCTNCMNGTVAPTKVERTSNGEAINWFMDLTPGSTSVWLQIDTDASRFVSVPGAVSFIDAGVVSVPGFSSVSGVPEASTWAMLLLGFAGLGFAARRTRKRGISIV
jgi:MYXO-CTERM domain-containing protein